MYCTLLDWDKRLKKERDEEQTKGKGKERKLPYPLTRLD
jgi:hypothetical protein